MGEDVKVTVRACVRVNFRVRMRVSSVSTLLSGV